jgi:hypothetical protein
MENSGGPVDEVLRSISDFPCALADRADKLSTTKYRCSFPLYHPSLYRSNIIVDEDFRFLAVIDWEGTSTVPREVVEPPLFLVRLPGDNA